MLKTGISDLKQVLKIELVVATDVCASVPVQCNADTANQHSFQPANSTNHNPFPLRMLVTKNGLPVTGLQASNFLYNNSFVPAGGTTSVKCESDCGTDWFQADTSGLYSMFIDRSTVNDLNNWKVGNYAATIQVSATDGSQGSALVAFKIE